MFYGLNKLIKKILPKRFFYRSLIIVAAPIILLQIIITIVFLDSLWIKSSKGMTRALVGEIVTIIDIYNNDSKYNKKIVTDLYNQNFNFSVRFLENEKLPLIRKERWFSPMDRTLRRELKSRFNDYWFSTTDNKEIVDLRIKFNDGVLQIFFPKDRIQTSSFRIFVLWITLPAFLLIFIAILFLKNQTRPIVNLAKAAERFGKGEFVEEFRPSGALEIRQAAYEFERMKKRISRHLKQRSEMLSGISHDLRTPLTRLKLQLAFLKDKKIAEAMSDDVIEMEKMLNEYLQFSKSQFKENTETLNLDDLINETILQYKNKNINYSNNIKIFINGRHNLLKRCLNNLIDNSLKFGNEVKIAVKKSINNVVILVDDNGPGIPENETSNVIKPFYKIDKSRGKETSSVGLGLSIASDIVRSHGGNLTLEKSPQKGLRVKIVLPF